MIFRGEESPTALLQSAQGIVSGELQEGYSPGYITKPLFSKTTFPPVLSG